MSTASQNQSQTESLLEGGSLLDELLSSTPLAADADSLSLAKQGVGAFIAELLKSPDAKVDKAAVDAMIAELDSRLSGQVNQILHAPPVQKLESAWRGLKFVVDSVDFRQNVRVNLLNVSKEDLLADFEDSPEIVKSGLYRTVYSAEYGTFGGQPYGVICSTYEFNSGPQDVALLKNCAAVAAMSHAPFLGNAAPEMFGVKTYEELTRLKDLESLFEGPQYARWNGFRDSEDARYVGVCAPRFMLRVPYGADTVPSKSFGFEEDVVDQHQNYLWGHSSLALATRVADSFAKYRWAPNIVGPQAGGAVEGLPLHNYKAMGEIQTKLPVEIQLTERREFELAEAGFIGLTMRKGSDNAAFFSANSAQRPKVFPNTPEGKADEANFRLGTQLPYMFVITRLSHYLKVMQREQIGTFKSRVDLETELNRWISQYVADMEAPSPGVRASRPLRQAKITVEDVDGQPGWYRCNLQVRPHFKYMGAYFTLSLVGKLDKQ
ncbi:MAG TPA: type VI secretion system contractile sheath large subunit [Nannocystaceae bacterium]|nr:type VI secretion system contractile sheath large subunit [Nannocystaceae bacterium]